MTQALIQIDGVTGSNPPNGVALALGATVAVTNVNNGGEVSYLWEFVDRPENSAAAFANPAVQTTSFVVDVEGTYVIRLTVNAARADERTNTVIAAVSQLLTEDRIPGATETTQANTLRGWAEAVNRWLKRLDRLAADSGQMVHPIVSGASRGQVVYCDQTTTIRTALPEAATVPGFALALASSLTHMQMPLCIVEGQPDGNTVVVAGELGKLRSVGLFGPLAGAPAVGAAVYVNDSAQVSLTPGTYTRRIGTVVWTDGANYLAYLDGTAWRVNVIADAVLVDAAVASTEFPNSVPIQAIPNTGLEFISPTASTNAHVVARFTPSNGTIDAVELTGLGSVRLGENGYLIGPVGNPLTLMAEAGNPVVMFSDANTNLAWIIDHTTGHLRSQSGQLVRNIAAPVAGTDAAHKTYVDQIGETFRWGNTDVPAGSTVYLDPCWSRGTAAATRIDQVSPHAGSVTKMYATARVAGGGDPVELALMINGVVTLATLSFTAGNTYLTATFAPPIAVAVGDRIALEVKTGAATATPTDLVVAVKMTR